MSNEVNVNEVDTKKELLELINALQPIAIAGVKIAADGKINFADLKHVGELLGSFMVIKEGVVGLKGINFKDLEKPELEELGQAAFNMIKVVIAAYQNERK